METTVTVDEHERTSTMSRADRRFLRWYGISPDSVDWLRATPAVGIVVTILPTDKADYWIGISRNGGLHTSWSRYLPLLIHDSIQELGVLPEDVRWEVCGSGIVTDEPSIYPPKIARTPRTGFVYFIQQGAAGLIKIGMTTRLPARFRDIGREILGSIRLLGAIQTTHPANLEQHLHAQFHDLRVHGEWFRPDERLLAEIAKVSTPAPEMV